MRELVACERLAGASDVVVSVSGVWSSLVVVMKTMCEEGRKRKYERKIVFWYYYSSHYYSYIP
jgi:hypothetical protein